MKESLTISKILKIFFSIYLAGSLFYATLHLLGLGWSSSQQKNTITSSSVASSYSTAPRAESFSVTQLQQKYLTSQTVTWTNAEGKKEKSYRAEPTKKLIYLYRRPKSFNSGGLSIKQSIF
jgi:hypothetical protein